MPAALPWFAPSSAARTPSPVRSVERVVAELVDTLLDDPEAILGAVIWPPKVTRVRTRKGKEVPVHGGPRASEESASSSDASPTTDHALEETLEGEDPTQKEAGASLPAPSPSRCRVVDKRGVVVSEHDGVENATAANTTARRSGRPTRVIRVIDNTPMTQWSHARIDAYALHGMENVYDSDRGSGEHPQASAQRRLRGLRAVR